MGLNIHCPGSVGPTVELDAFSGRPNPTWQLTVAETRQFADLAVRLDSGVQTAFPRDVLGYRGMIVTGCADLAEIVVSNGSVTAGNQHWVDHDRTLEAFLLDTAKTRLDSQIYEHVLSQFREQRDEGQN